MTDVRKGFVDLLIVPTSENMLWTEKLPLPSNTGREANIPVLKGSSWDSLRTYTLHRGVDLTRSPRRGKEDSQEVLTIGLRWKNDA